jgi:dolichyl-phosphate-mannose--protein O-mannosyl transferase
MDPHKGKNAMCSCRPKVEYATDTMVGRIVRLKSYRVQGKKGANTFVIAGASAYRLQISCFQCYLRHNSTKLFAWNFASQYVIIMENYTNREMTDMVLCYGSSDGVALRAQALYREKLRRLPHSQTFLAV